MIFSSKTCIKVNIEKYENFVPKLMYGKSSAKNKP
jgi:hypothetical protein